MRDLYVPDSVTKRCDNTSVGILIPDPDGRLLLFRRVTPPVGMAPPAGHIDEHGTAIDAAIAEVREETGLIVRTLRRTRTTQVWRDNVCRRQPGPRGFGHEWTVFDADVTGQLQLGPEEAADAVWATPDYLGVLAGRTIDLALGLVTAEEFAAHPGLEPVWASFLAGEGYVHLSDGDLAAIEKLATASPYPQPGGAP